MPGGAAANPECFQGRHRGCCKLPADDAQYSSAGVIWRVFKRLGAAGGRQAPVWWKIADAIAEHPDAGTLRSLQAQPAAESLDEAEQREEMLDGLRQLVELAAADQPPIIQTQHRVIGTDACYFVAPATLVEDVGTPGKLFLTSNRLVFAGGRVQAWPWHRLRDMRRRGRDLFIALAGATDAVRLQCNTFGDAMIARHLAMWFTRSRQA
jgi:hypothetical protein